MITEEGIVVRKDSGNTVWVEAVRHSACEGCASKGACQAGSENKMEARAVNSAGADIGDKVVMEVSQSSMVKVSLLLYLVPVVFLIFGAFAGERLSVGMTMDPQAVSALCGFGALFIAVVIVVVVGRRAARDERYIPKVTRIIS